MWNIGDRVVRKSKPSEPGMVIVQQYTAWDDNGEYVKVLWQEHHSCGSHQS